MDVVCDVAHLLLVEQVTARALADRQGAFVVLAMGGDVGEFPDPELAAAKLEAALTADPTDTPTDSDVVRLAKFLGVA